MQKELSAVELAMRRQSAKGAPATAASLSALASKVDELCGSMSRLQVRDESSESA